MTPKNCHPSAVVLDTKQPDLSAHLRDFLTSGSVLEIGFGKGLFLLQAAQAFPAKRYLGIEKAARHVRFAAPRFSKRGIANVRLVHGYAEKLLPELIPDRIFQEIYIFHPDPWPKRRHAARRTLQAPFWRLLAGKMSPRGYILLLTDSADYFGQIRDELAKVRELAVEIAPFERLPKTNFTIKYARAGRIFYHLLAWPAGQEPEPAHWSKNFLFASAG